MRVLSVNMDKTLEQGAWHIENIQLMVVTIIAFCPVLSISATKNNQLQFLNQNLITLQNKDTAIARLHLVKLNIDSELKDCLQKPIFLWIELRVPIPLGKSKQLMPHTAPLLPTRMRGPLLAAAQWAAERLLTLRLPAPEEPPQNSPSPASRTDRLPCRFVLLLALPRAATADNFHNQITQKKNCS